VANLFARYEGESYPGQFHVVCEDDVENPQRYGWGHSHQEALAAWAEVVLERVDDHLYDLRAAGVIDPQVAEACFTDIDEQFEQEEDQ
jgi:hypothetical protein